MWLRARGRLALPHVRLKLELLYLVTITWTWQDEQHAHGTHFQPRIARIVAYVYWWYV
jgi:hypothetical protein